MPFKKDTILTWLPLALTVLLPAASSVDTSDFPGRQAESRAAYYRWRSWLLTRPATLHKVPPALVTSPPADDAPPYAVNIKFSAARISNVDQVRQTYLFSGRFDIFWVDEALALNASLVSSFTEGNASLLPSKVAVPLTSLWAPKIILVENDGDGDADLTFLHDGLTAWVTQSGQVTLILPYTKTVACRFDMTAYPFDEHDCALTFLDVTYTVNVLPFGGPWNEAFFQAYSVEGEWDLTALRYTTQANLYSTLNNTQFVLHIKRKTAYYGALIVLPMVLTSYLNVLVFLLPPEYGDKASYLVTISISLSVFTSFFNADMPRGLTSLPAIVVLLIFVCIESFVCILLSLLVLRRHQAEQAAQGDPVAAATSIVHVSPAARAGQEGKESGERRRSRPASTWYVSARRLDGIFFVSVLTVNTVAVLAILGSLF